MQIKRIIIFSILLFIGLLYSCELTDLEEVDTTVIDDGSNLIVNIAKWYDNHAAALSITNDAGNVMADGEKIVQQLVEKNGLNISYEFVTEKYVTDSLRRDYLFEEYLPKGFGYYGHGHTHINHDSLSESESYESFKKCYDTMIDLGLEPVSCAYPGGFGYKIRTQKALKEAGFLSGRKYEKLDFDFPYIMPDDVNEPENWFQLPTLVMQAYDLKYCSICINNTDELIEYLDKTVDKKAWIILTYHSIGQLGSYGYYDLDEFETDLFAIKSRDFWVTSLDDITLYTYARNATKINVQLKKSSTDQLEKISIRITNDLNNPIFDVPLTLLIELPKEWNKDVELLKNSKELVEVKSGENRLKISLKPNEEIVLSQK